MTEQDQSLDARWDNFEAACQACTACTLFQARKQAVIYRGSREAPLMIVGEGPGAEEDRLGIPFVGRSGQLLDMLLGAYELDESVFHICNIVKCRPPGNRTPTADEAAACKQWLGIQFKLVKPQVIVLMGASAYRYFTGNTDGISKVRGVWMENRGYDILPTFHPAYILRDNRRKIDLWHDFGLVRKKLEERGLIVPLSVQPDMPS